MRRMNFLLFTAFVAENLVNIKTYISNIFKLNNNLYAYQLRNQSRLAMVKVHLNPKYFFCLNKSLHLFETHFAFLNLILTFL